jgi:hypothetical protein
MPTGRTGKMLNIFAFGKKVRSNLAEINFTGGSYIWIDFVELAAKYANAR